MIAPFLADRLLADPDALRIQFQHRFGTQDANLRAAYCAVEFALYDALGKALSVPVSELAGGRVRDRIKIFSHSADLSEAYASGIRACELRPAGPLNQQTLDDIHQAREAGGEDMDVMVDARCPDALLSKMAEELAADHAVWIRDPLPAHDAEGYARLHGLNLVPVARTIDEASGHGFYELAASESVDYAVGDLFGQGGVPGFRRIAPDIGDSGVRFAFRHGGTVFELLVAAHLGICWPETAVEWVEYAELSPGGLLKEPLVIDQGDLVVPQGPGFGVTIDEDRLTELLR